LAILARHSLDPVPRLKTVRATVPEGVEWAITKALAKIEDGTFGTCEECGEDISIKRLEARPETTLCIRCKEDQERMEKDYG